ncbi:MAG: 4-alpha-glucanotransferase [Nitrospirota bacterium]
MSKIDDLIHELSELCGIVSEYWDILGKKHITPVETKKAILSAMKMKIDSEEDAVKEIHERKWKPWRSFIEPVHVVSVKEQPFKVPVYIPIHEGEEKRLSLSWSIESENNPPDTPLWKRGARGDFKGEVDGLSGEKDEYVLSGDSITISEQQWINGIRYIKINIQDTGNRDIGYYVIHVECKHPENIFPEGVNLLKKTSRIIVTPDACFIPPELHNRRTWGLSINLYSIRSFRNWGIGDFTDLKEIVRWTADLKGGFVGINPLHALQNTKPFGISPYSPISRLYKNYIYLDIEEIPEVSESEEAQTFMKSGPFKEEITRLRKSKFIDYGKIAVLKREILRHAFNLFYEKHFIQDTQRAQDFKRYLSEESNSLESFSLFLSLWEHMMKAYHAYTWQQWFRYYHVPNNTVVQEFRKLHEKEILFNSYIQWLIDGQLKEAVKLTRELGMVVGLYNDLAIGSVGGGCDAWNYQDVIGGADVGAPPDDFSPDGQNWGFPPMIPERLRETGYELFIQTIRKNMKHGGALRIDHAPGLFRLYWIPYGISPKESAYIRYPSEDLLRIIALESVRNKTMVIAEDLGTVGENVRETLKKFQMLSYKLFYFERNYPDPSFLPPEKYPDMALCAVTTHDLPTIYGYWKGQDIKMRKKLGMYTDEGLWQRHIEERDRDKQLIISALKSQGIILEDFPSKPKRLAQMTPELCIAIYQYLARTPCKLLHVSLDDVIGNLNQQNMPGTVDSYPNWMQKTPLTLEEMVEDERFVDLSEMLSRTIAS